MELQQTHLTKLAPNPPKYFVDCEALRGEVVDAHYSDCFIFGLFLESNLPHGAFEVLPVLVQACRGIPLLEQCPPMLPRLSCKQESPRGTY